MYYRTQVKNQRKISEDDEQIGNSPILTTLLGVFAKLWKATINFVVFVCPSVRMEHLGCHRVDFREILYNRDFSKTYRVSLKYDKNNGYFTGTPVQMFGHISLIFSS